MELYQNIGLILAGLTFLYFGADWLVDGASKIALKVGISPLVVGLTIVALGTSAPELLVCIQANANNQPDIALGNIIGSNICNIALILGIAALIKPIKINKQIIKKEMPILIGITVIFLLMLIDGKVSTIEGILLTGSVIAYSIISIIQSRKENTKEPQEKQVNTTEKHVVLKSLGLILVGLVTLKYGSEWLVNGGTYVAQAMGVNEAIIALFLFALGTSLPELATSIVAIRKGEGDIIVGNAIGSCIFNILAVIGITAIIKPIIQGNIEQIDKFVMLGVTIAIFTFMWHKMQLNKFEGVFLLFGYIAYSIVRINL